MRKIILFALLLLVSFSLVTALDTIVDFDSGGTNWDGGSATNGEDIINGGWTQAEAGDFVYDSSTDYDGDGMSIKWSTGDPRYYYSNSSLASNTLSVMFYDSGDSSAYMYAAPLTQTNYDTLLGVSTSVSSSYYVYDNPIKASSVARTTGWHEFKWYYNVTDSYMYSYINDTFVYKEDFSGKSIQDIESVHIYADSGSACSNCAFDQFEFKVAQSDSYAPIISAINCTSCNIPFGDTSSPYSTEDTTPTFKLETDVDSSCRVSATNSNYTTMSSSRDCTSSTLGTSHSCSVTSQDEFATTTSYAYISCVNNHNLNETSSPQLEVQIQNLEGTTISAIDKGIQTSSVWPGATVYSNQQVYLRDASNNQVLATADKVVVYGNQRWIINVAFDQQSTLGLFNITPVVYTLDMVNTSSSGITSKVSALINSTQN